MSAAVTQIYGPKAEQVAKDLAKILQQRKCFGKQTFVVNGESEVWEISERNAQKVVINENVVELATHIPNPEAILADLTLIHPNLFGTTVKLPSGSTIGAVDGNVF